MDNTLATAPGWTRIFAKLLTLALVGAFNKKKALVILSDCKTSRWFIPSYPLHWGGTRRNWDLPEN